MTLEDIKNELCKINMLYLQNEKSDIMRGKMEISSISSRNYEDKTYPILFNRNRLVCQGHFKDTSLTDSSILVYKNVDGKNWKDLYHEYVKHKYDFLVVLFYPILQQR